MTQTIKQLKAQHIGTQVIYKGDRGTVKDVKQMAEPMALVQFPDGHTAILKISEFSAPIAYTISAEAIMAAAEAQA